MTDSRSYRAVLLDIEGTVSSIRFVYDEMFPFARREIPQYVATHFSDSAFAPTVEAIAADLGFDSAQAWWESREIGESDRSKVVVDAAIGMMDDDKKATGLKRLQGEVWQAGFESGELVSHHYDDFISAINRWKEQGVEMRIYSSGSVAAQLLFFRYTQSGNLLDYFSGHYDTTTGPKKESQSYVSIATDMNVSVGDVLFCSDSVDEVNAARQAGMQTALCIRPGNPEVTDDCGHMTIHSFDTLFIGH